LNYTKSRLKTC